MARGKAGMKSPEARTSRETHKPQDRDAVAAGVGPSELLGGPLGDGCAFWVLQTEV